MILGIGTDMTPVARIAETLLRHGARFEVRCFAESERQAAAARGSVQRASFYAKRWAAKEAVAKALGLGIDGGIFLKDIVIENNAAGRPFVRLAGGAAERLAILLPRGYKGQIDLSLSDDGGLALAFVVISATQGAERTQST